MLLRMLAQRPESRRDPPVARVLALDLGSKRIGVATSDLTRTLASPLTVVVRGRTHEEDHRAIAKLVDEYEPDTIIVGLPLGLDGNEGRAAALIRGEVDELVARVVVPVVLHDERFSTVAANRVLAAQEIKARQRRHVVDKVAAAVFLQSWLDMHAEVDGAQANVAQGGAAKYSDRASTNSAETYEHPRGLAPDFSGRSGRRAGR